MLNKEKTFSRAGAGVGFKSDLKNLTSGLGIEVMPAPKTVCIPLKQHSGLESRPAVNINDRVKAGQLIASAAGAVSANIFSSVSGTVTDIREMDTPVGKCVHIVIENDFKEEEALLPSLTVLAPEEIIKRAEEAGIAGMGGAGFPLSVKLKVKTKIDTLIINGAECEPYITCDLKVMTHYTKEFVFGALLLAKAVGASKTVIAIEDNKPAAVEKVEGFIKTEALDNVSVTVLSSRYPQGAEKQLIYAVTGRKVEPGKLPSSKGVIVNNAHTAFSLYFAVNNGQPVYKRIVTVSGKGINRPADLWVLTGTMYYDIIEYLGGYNKGANKTVKLLCGGPMMGNSVESDAAAVTKTTSCILFLTEAEAFLGSAKPCINCGKCAIACPMRLMPMFIDAYILAGDVKNAVKYGSRSCIECGCCAYICPAKRPLVQSIRLAKKKDAELRG